MARINELNIKITKAVITRVIIELQDDKPSYSIFGQFISEQGLRVSDFHFMSSSWGQDSKIEIPPELHVYSSQLFKALTPVIYEKINGRFLQLGDGKK